MKRYFIIIFIMLIITAKMPHLNASALSSEEIARRFPVCQTMQARTILGGDVLGFGMLAYYEAPGMKEVYVKRTTTVDSKEPFRPAALAKVLDPDGYQIAVHEFTEQPTGSEEYILSLPLRKAGIWTVSFIGGRKDDIFEIRLPSTQIWGVRGEMALSLSATTPNPGYLYVPRTTEVVIMQELENTNPGSELFDNNGVSLGKPKNVSGRYLNVVDVKGTDVTYSVGFDTYQKKSLVFDGIPGLLCPTKLAAETLKGGTVEADGLLVAGQLQANIRKSMLGFTDEDLAFSFEFPENLPEALIDATIEAHSANAVRTIYSSTSKQVMDRNNPYYGAIIPQEDLAKRISWETFLYGSNIPGANASYGLSNLVTTPGLTNPAYLNKALINRATLSTFLEFVKTQGDFLMREGDFRTKSYPITHTFFLYDWQLAAPLENLKDYLDPEIRLLWSEALISVGDKVANYKAYESNQWAHMMLGHLHTYMATGEKRFLGYFERQMTSYLDLTHGISSKYGQHPAGYYLEEYGPDGNYDSLNAYVICEAYLNYKKLPEAKSELVEKLHSSIEKNLNFKSFYWLPQPNGELISPQAMSARKTAQLGSSNYPSEDIVRNYFPLAMARHMLTPVTLSMSGSTKINDYDWALSSLRRDLGYKGNMNSNTVTGGWTYMSYLASFNEVNTDVDLKIVPALSDGGVWELPGQIAWKNGELYGLIFYDIAGSTQFPSQSKYGGGPTTFYTKGVGSAVMSMKNVSDGTVSKADDVVNSCVYGYTKDGKMFFTDNKRSTFEWVSEGETFKITTPISSPNTTLTWQYTIKNNETQIQVKLAPNDFIGKAYINLPINASDSKAQISLPTSNSLKYAVLGNDITFTWDKNLVANLTDKLNTSRIDVKNLVLELPADGKFYSIFVNSH